MGGMSFTFSADEENIPIILDVKQKNKHNNFSQALNHIIKEFGKKVKK